jgi:hypothetical protein
MSFASLFHSLFPQPFAAVAQTASERHLLRRRLEHARLAQVLRRMHVSTGTYLRRTHPEQLGEQLEACAACPHTFHCDQVIACPPEAKVEPEFCPNHAAIAALQRVAYR